MKKKESFDWVGIIYQKQLSFRNKEEQEIIKKFIFDLCASAVACTIASKIIIDAFNELNEDGSKRS